MSITPPPSVQPPQPPNGAPAAPPVSAGTAPVTQQVPNRGSEVMAAQRTALIVQLMGETIGIAGGGSELGLALADSMRKLAKFAPSGAGNHTANADALNQLRMKQLQMSQMPQQQKPPGT